MRLAFSSAVCPSGLGRPSVLTSYTTPAWQNYEVFGRSESGSRILAMSDMRTRSDRLAACILVMRFAR